MAVAQSYAQRDDVKTLLGIPLEDHQDDGLIDRVLAATTTKINDHCNVHRVTGFNKDAAPSARVFQARLPDTLIVDDIADAATLTVTTGQAGSFVDTVNAADFEARPLNAPSNNWPYQYLHHHWSFWPTWPSVRIQIVTTWGWPAVPEDLFYGQQLWAARLFERRKSLNGLAGQSDFGPIRVGRIDPDIIDMLEDYVRPGFA